jgi:peptidoglycan/xylan/chitin deacetylase (PgdA/CDA1 family)
VVEDEVVDEMKRYFRVFFHVILGIIFLSGEAVSYDFLPSGVALNYFGFGDRAGNSGIRLDELEEHLEILSEENYNVLPLGELVERLSNGDETLPLRTVSLMWSGSSPTFEKGWEIFRRYGFPLTVFVPVGKVGTRGSLSWDFLREMVSSGLVEVGSQGLGLTNLTKLPAEEVMENLKASREKMKEELGEEVYLFSYPFGLASVGVERMAYGAGFRVGMGQHSGAFNRRYNRFYLPSFGMTRNYSDERRLRLILSTLALPLGKVEYRSLVREDENPPDVRVWFDKDWDSRSVNMLCFHSRQGRLEVEGLGEREGFSPVFASPLKRGRSRLNCTGQVQGKGTIWWGVQFFVPR